MAQRSLWFVRHLVTRNQVAGGCTAHSLLEWPLRDLWMLMSSPSKSGKQRWTITSIQKWTVVPGDQSSSNNLDPRWMMKVLLIARQIHCFVERLIVKSSAIIKILSCASHLKTNPCRISWMACAFRLGLFHAACCCLLWLFSYNSQSIWVPLIVHYGLRASELRPPSCMVVPVRSGVYCNLVAVLAVFIIWYFPSSLKFGYWEMVCVK